MYKPWSKQYLASLYPGSGIILNPQNAVVTEQNTASHALAMINISNQYQPAQQRPQSAAFLHEWQALSTDAANA